MDYASTTQAVYVDPGSRARPNRERTHIPRKEALDKEFWKVAEDELKERLSKLKKEQYHSDAQWCSESHAHFRSAKVSSGVGLEETSAQGGGEPVTVYSYLSDLKASEAQDVLEYLREELSKEIDASRHDQHLHLPFTTPHQIKEFLRPYSLHARLTQVQLHAIASHLAGLGVTGNQVLQILSSRDNAQVETKKPGIKYSVSYTDENNVLHEKVLEVCPRERFPLSPSFPQDLPITRYLLRRQGIMVADVLDIQRIE